MSCHLDHGLEVSKAQEELVRLNLVVKALNTEFEGCQSHKQMADQNAEIRRQLDNMRRILDVLRDLANRQQDPQAAKMLMKDVENHCDQISALQVAFKQANIKCIQRLDKSGRCSLMTKQDPGEVRQRRRQVEKEEVVRQSSQATDKLASISRQLAETVEKSSATVSTLAESSQTVFDTKEEFTGLGALVGQSKRLITKYARRETTDKVLILFAVAFFFAVVFYILRKRVLGPLDPFALVWTTVRSIVIAIIKIIKAIQAYVSEYLL